MMVSCRWKWETNSYQVVCRLPDLTHRCYLGKVIGPDPNHVLQRKLINQNTLCQDPWGYAAQFQLSEDGIYDLWIRRTDPETGKSHAEHKWLILFDEIVYVYDRSEMNAQYVLLTLYNLQCQTAQQNLVKGVR